MAILTMGTNLRIGISRSSRWLALLVINAAIAQSHASSGKFFAGGEIEAESSTSFLRARHYDPETGTFLTKDPMGVSSDVNGYRYCYNNPINVVDPNGENPILIIGLVAYLLLNNPDVANAPAPGDPTYSSNGAGGMVFDSMALGVGAGIGKGVGTVLASKTVERTVVIPTLSQVAKILPGQAGTIVTQDGAKVAANFAQLTYAETFSSKGASLYGVPSIDALSARIASGAAAPTVEYGLSSAGTAIVANTRTLQAYLRAGVTPIGTQIMEGGMSQTLLANQLAYNGLAGGAGSSFAVSRATIAGVANGLGNISGLGVFSGLTTQKPAGVLIDKAAELVGQNLADIKGATYDPESNQIVFLGSNSTPGVEGIDMDYFYTAVEAVYGSAVPPFVSLDAPASPNSLWQDLGDGDGSFEPQEWGGFSLRYNPLWSEQDHDIGIRINCKIGSSNYDFTVHLTPQTIDWLQYPNGQYPMHLVYSSITGTAPPGISVWTGPFTNLPYPQTVLDYVNTGSTLNGGQDWYYPFQLFNNGTGTITNISFAVIPDRQHRRFGGRLEGTKLGWVLQEADRIMKCLAIGKDNVTGATYSSATIPISGYKNLAEINASGTSVSGNTRVWFLADEMKLKRHSDPASGRATIVFDQAVIGVKTESALNFQAQSPGVAAFASFLQSHFEDFAGREFPVVSPDDPSGQTMVNVRIFKMLKDAMQAVSLARFFRDNNIPLDMWWMNSWKPPTAYSPKSVATINNESLGVVLYGGVNNRKVNTYTPSSAAQAVGTSVASVRPAATIHPAEDLKEQAWTASTSEGTFRAVATSMKSGTAEGIINLAETDLSFASPGALPLEFTRYYQSGYVGDSVLGPGWRVGRYVLEFERPSWFDENNMMKYFGNQLVPRDDKSDTRLRSGAVRLIDLATGATLDFNSSFVVNYYQDAAGNPKVSLSGLTAEQVPVFTEGARQDGTVLVQNDDDVKGYTAYLPDGSSLVFDPEGRLETSKDRHGKAQWYSRDTLGRVVTIEDSVGRQLTLTYSSTTGRMTRVTGPQNERTDYSYDTAGRLEAVVHQRSGAVIAQYTYNASNQLLNVTRFDGTKLVTTTPDLKGRSDERKDSRDNSFDFSFLQNGNIRTTQVQDDGSSLGPSKQTADGMGRTTSVSDPLNNTVHFAYTGSSLLPNTIRLPTPDRPAIGILRNAKGQPTSISDAAIPGAQTVQLAYNAANRVTQVSDEAGRAIQADYNTTQDLTKVRRFLGGSAVEVGYGYQNGYLRTVTNPLNKTWTTNRDAYGRVTSVVDPTGVTVSYEYDALGRLWKISDPRLSSPVTFTFDNLDRVLTVTTPAGTTTYTYDPVTKWLKTVTDVANHTVTLTRNSTTGDIVKASYQLSQPGGQTTTYETNYGYTRFGDIESVAAPGTQPTSFQIDDLGRLTDVSETDAGIFDTPRALASNNAQNGVWTKNKNHVFTWGAPESSVPVDGYSFAQDTTAPQTVTTTSPTAVWNGVSDGQHTAHVRAKNTNNFWGPEAIFNLWVDSVAPSISSVSASPNPVPVGPSSVTISTTVQDATSGLASGQPRIRWCISSDSQRPWSAWQSMTSSGGNAWTFNASHSGAQAENSRLYYEIQAADLAANSANAAGSVAMNYSGGGVGVPAGSPTAITVLIAVALALAARRLVLRRPLAV